MCSRNLSVNSCLFGHSTTTTTPSNVISGRTVKLNTTHCFATCSGGSITYATNPKWNIRCYCCTLLRMLLSRQVYRMSLRRLLKDVTCCSDTWPDWTPPLQRIRSWSKSLLSSPDASPTLSGGELLDVLVTLGSCRLAMDHHWVSDGSGRRHRITVIMESRRNGPQLSSRHDDDGSPYSNGLTSDQSIKTHLFSAMCQIQSRWCG